MMTRVSPHQFNGYALNRSCYRRSDHFIFVPIEGTEKAKEHFVRLMFNSRQQASDVLSQSGMASSWTTMSWRSCCGAETDEWPARPYWYARAHGH